MLRSAVRSASLPLAAIGTLLLACDVPESFRMSGDAGAALTLPDSGWGTGGYAPGTGGLLTGSGSREGGMTGSGGGAAAGGKAGSTDAGGNNGAGGTPTASGGAGGGTVGSGGNGGGLVSAGGMPGNGGAIGAAGRSGGGAGAGGSSGKGGAMGAGGAAGATIGPCAGVCANPTEFTTRSYDPGPVGLGAACFETTADIQGGKCFDFLGRTLKVNGMLKICNPAAGFQTF
jgi:hypothetical protein